MGSEMCIRDRDATPIGITRMDHGDIHRFQGTTPDCPPRRASQTGRRVRTRASAPRRAHRHHALPHRDKGFVPAGMACQTDLIMAERDHPVVNFLEVDEDSFEQSTIPNCFHFASSKLIVKSPKIPVIVEGVRVPMIIDTGAEISALPLLSLTHSFPGKFRPNQSFELLVLEALQSA